MAPQVDDRDRIRRPVAPQVVGSAYAASGGPMLPWVLGAVLPMAAFGGAGLLSLAAAQRAVKPLAVALLAMGVARTGDRPGRLLLAGAMAVDAVADGVIEVAFLGGLALFLVGHLLRIAAFTRDEPALHPARAIPFALVAVAALALVLPGAGALGAPIALYAIAIATMGWRAAARGGIGLAGAVLYLTSDSLLAVNKFVTPLPWADLWVMSTYWGAQALIAVSARREG